MTFKFGLGFILIGINIVIILLALASGYPYQLGGALLALECCVIGVALIEQSDGQKSNKLR